MAKSNHSAFRYLPNTSADAAAIPLASLGTDALTEALQGGVDADARRAMARLIAAHGRKYTPEARALAAAIAFGDVVAPAAAAE